MSDETPVERRLRELAHCPHCVDGYAAPGLPCIICEQRITTKERADIDCGREAIRLLRDYERACDAPPWPESDEKARWEADVAVLLAKCREER